MFREIILAVTTEIINFQFQIISDLNRQHESLYSALLNGEKVDVFNNFVGTQLECACACVSDFGEVLARYSPDGMELPFDLELSKICSRVTDLVRTKAFDFSVQQMGEYHVFPCRVQNRMIGSFILCQPRELTNREVLIAKQMTSFLSVKLLENQLIQENKRQMITPIIDEILFRPGQDSEMLKERLNLLHFQIEKSFRVLLFSSPLNTATHGHLGLELLNRSVHDLFPGCISHFVADGLTIIVPISSSSSYSKEQALNRKLNSLVKELTLTEKVGYSNQQTELNKIPEAYQQAKQAIHFGLAFSPEQQVYSYGDFPELIMVSHTLNTSDGALLYHHIINPILNYDQKYQTQLWETLEHCLHCSSLEKAAQALFIHPSTLRYRLKKIGELTDTDYFTNSGKYMLHTAYIFAKLSN